MDAGIQRHSERKHGSDDTYTAIVAGGAGVATFYPTSNGTSGGTATFAVMKQINPRFDSGNPESR